MITSEILSIIRTKFIENFDEGLLLQGKEIVGTFEINPDYSKYFKEYYSFEQNQRLERRMLGRRISKKEPFSYLSFVLLNTKLARSTSSGGIEEYYPKYNDEFKNLFLNYWLPKANTLQAILNNAGEYINAESIAGDDLIFINVGYRSYERESPNSWYNKRIYDTFEVWNNGDVFSHTKKADSKGIDTSYADLFVFAKSKFIKLSLGADGPIERTLHLYQDIKKTNIAEKQILEIYFHGHYDPETIILNTYKQAIDLQNHLLDLKQNGSRKGHNGPSKRN